MTGIDSPYEPPDGPDHVADAWRRPIDQLVTELEELVRSRSSRPAGQALAASPCMAPSNARALAYTSSATLEDNETKHRKNPRDSIAMATRADFQRLRELWGNRSGATQEQWHELYTLVEAVLRRARILDGLDREDMVQGYFCDRVLCGRGSSVPDHEAALLAWFQRYQLDQLPRERRGDLSWVEGCEGCLGAPVVDAPDPAAELFRQQRAKRIATFFEALSEDERLLLQVSHCDGESVLSVQDQYRIRSAHYRSRQLGIVLGRNTLPEEWARSKIGRMVAELGLKIEATMGEDLLQVFRLLCERARQWWEARA